MTQVPRLPAFILRLFGKDPNAPNEIINDTVDGTDVPYLRRWYLRRKPKKETVVLYLHNFVRSDEDRALHDHVGWNVSILLSGRYREWVFADQKCAAPQRGMQTFHIRRPFIPVFRRATTAHRVELIDGPVWTLFLRGPYWRSWGFWCPTGWRSSRKFEANGCTE